MCPNCGSPPAWVKRRAGWERIMIALTGKRKFFCRLCYSSYRAPDRRRAPRFEGSHAGIERRRPEGGRRFIAPR